MTQSKRPLFLQSVPIIVKYFTLVILLACALGFSLSSEKTKPDAVATESALTGPFAPELEIKFADLSYDELLRELPPRDYLDKLDFDPPDARYFELACEELALTPTEIATFRREGLELIEQSPDQTPTTAFYSIYSSDLPVLITSDAILYALHKSYDEILMELESTWFSDSMNDVLAGTQAALPEDLSLVGDAALADSYRDVDFYLCVARRLLDPAAKVSSRFGQDPAVDEMLGKIASLKLEVPPRDSPTKLYGGERFMDYSQFKPRGHYIKSPQLRHDTILYAKQSHSSVPGCEYPAGYVEPYPEFYAAIKFFAKRAGELIGATPYAGEGPGPRAARGSARDQAIPAWPISRRFHILRSSTSARPK